MVTSAFLELHLALGNATVSNPKTTQEELKSNHICENRKISE